METFPLLVPLVILAPAIGAFINFFWGAKMGEKPAGYVAIGASVLTFIFSVLIFSFLSANHARGVVVDPPLFDGWIRILTDGHYSVDIPWQFRVDTLTSAMLLVVTGVGSLIHIYSVGYMHGDENYARFFGYLNLFLMFMLILVTGNNFLMMFVGWEGVGLCSFLLIGFWWQKANGEGWKNSDAARKAMILNRIGDFGILMAVFLMFWTFGTLDYYAPGEEANPYFQLEGYELVEDHDALDELLHVENGVRNVVTAEQLAALQTPHEGEAAADDHSEEGDYNEEGAYDDGYGSSVAAEDLTNQNFAPDQLGVFAQLDILMSLDEGEQYENWYLDGSSRGRTVSIGTLQVDISTMLFLIIIFMLLGVTGKSAQIPLFVWLPDAMAGPTPVSALMHAATMVTAGVYLMVRSNVFLDHSPEARFIIAMIGAATALVAGFIAVGQWDIKRVLAYSTVSQLGFMVAAVGVGAYVAAMFHLVTHAVFKALLFLGSGSVIHGVEHGHHHVHEHHGHDDDHHDAHAAEDHHDDFDPQDMRNMGGLWRRMPVTFVTYLAGTFALAGLPIFAGFWSKDEILLEAWHVGLFEGHLEGFIVFGVLLIAAFFTAFYMWRQIQLVFFGEPRSEAAAHAPESSAWMTVPLVVLAIGSVFVGLINVPYGFWPFSAIYKPHEFAHWLEAVIPSMVGKEIPAFSLFVGGTATILAFVAIFLAHRFYAAEKSSTIASLENGNDPLYDLPETQQAWVIANARGYWDDFYHRVVLQPYEDIGKFLADTLDWRFLHDYFHDKVIKRGYDTIGDLLSEPVDVGLVDGIVNGVGKIVSLISGETRKSQTGYVRTYAAALLLGVVVVVILMLLPLLQIGS